jgi:hypothetical protein
MGAAPLALTPAICLEHESEARAHLLQLVIDAASIPPARRPLGVDAHITRLWRAISELLFTTSPHRHARLVPDPAASNRRLTVERFIKSVDRPDERDDVVPGLPAGSIAGKIVGLIDGAIAAANDLPANLVAANDRRVLLVIRDELTALGEPIR